MSDKAAAQIQLILDRQILDQSVVSFHSLLFQYNQLVHNEWTNDLISQLSDNDTVNFDHNGLHFTVFLNSSNEYEYDVYDDQEEPKDGGINTDYTARQTIECLLEDY